MGTTHSRPTFSRDARLIRHHSGLSAAQREKVPTKKSIGPKWCAPSSEQDEGPPEAHDVPITEHF